jgi:tRNA-dihydrouridine synthase
MKSFWRELPRPFFILAPMEAVTDVIFRHVISNAAPPDVYFTEFTNATGWLHAGDKAIGGRLVKTDDEQPIVAQLWGSDPNAMAKLSAHCQKIGFHGIDINMGCPDSSAIKSGGGAQMIRTPDISAKMIEAAKTSGLPVSVKTRLGYSKIDEWYGWLSFILKQNIEVLSIHLRSKKEMSKVPAHFELIPDIVSLRDKIAPDTLLVINGDIHDRKHGEQLVKETPGIDGIMIGRGVFHNPFAFEQTPKKHSKKELLGLLNYQLDLYDEYSNLTNRPFDTLKRFFKIYIRDFEGAAELRHQLMQTKSTDEVRSLIVDMRVVDTK